MMYIEQIYTGCLAHGAYYIESNGEAAIIDPLRETEPYIRMAKERNARIRYVMETHFHADFVSGHVDLAQKTGASIIYGPTTMQTGFEALIADDGQEFPLGDVAIRLIHTPGHTMESSCYLLIDEHGKKQALFTGDTLFIGDVGRPDLAQKVIADLTQEKLASMLFDSLRNKIMPLPDDLIIYPAHGAGSACGKNMSKETSDTLGHQKETNYALRPDMTREEFMQELLTGLTPPPGYFPKNVLMNIGGYDQFDEVMKRGSQALSPEAFEAAANETGAVILDTRDQEKFAEGFIPNAINISLDGNFAVWVGTLIPDIDQQILLVAEPGREKEAVTRMARVGYDHCIGFLEGGMRKWINARKETDTISSLTPQELAQRWPNNETILLDVRKKSEYDSEHVEGAENLALDYINQNMQEIDPEKTYYVHCLTGYRSMTFISILKARGFEKLINVMGGFEAIKNSKLFTLTDYVCPTTML